MKYLYHIVDIKPEDINIKDNLYLYFMSSMRNESLKFKSLKQDFKLIMGNFRNSVRRADAVTFNCDMLQVKVQRTS